MLTFNGIILFFKGLKTLTMLSITLYKRSRPPSTDRKSIRGLLVSMSSSLRSLLTASSPFLKQRYLLYAAVNEQQNTSSSRISAQDTLLPLNLSNTSSSLLKEWFLDTSLTMPPMLIRSVSSRDRVLASSVCIHW